MNIISNISLRRERVDDHVAVENLTREAFWNVHVPGCDEHYLAHVLRQAPAFVPELDYVAELEGRIVGNIMYAKALLHLDTGSSCDLLTFGPLSVDPNWQKRGIGAALVRQTLDLARGLDYLAVIIYGDPAYYCRFGFRAAESFGICGEEGWSSPALQALELKPGALAGRSGCFAEGDAYHPDQQAAASFELGFPPKLKQKTSSQARFQDLLSQAHRKA